MDVLESYKLQSSVSVFVLTEHEVAHQSLHSQSLTGLLSDSSFKSSLFPLLRFDNLTVLGG